jgi:hypothetical protein
MLLDKFPLTRSVRRRMWDLPGQVIDLEGAAEHCAYPIQLKRDSRSEEGAERSTRTSARGRYELSVDPPGMKRAVSGRSRVEGSSSQGGQCVDATTISALRPSSRAGGIKV